MKLLVILPRVPYPLEKGDKLRAYNQIRFLSKTNEITLCALNDTKLHPNAKSELKPYCKRLYILNISKWSIILNLFKALFKGIPFQVGYFYNRKAKQQIQQIINEVQPDHIYCQLIRVAEYVKNNSTPKTIDYQDVFSKGVERRIATSPFYLRPLLRMEYKRLLKYECNIFDIFNNKTIISAPDRDLIPHPERKKIHIIPNGVDTEFFKPMDVEKQFEIVFIGNMGYPPNVDAAEYLAKEILPQVKKRYPDARLLLAGATPTQRVKNLENESVVVTGWVDDIRQCYAQAKIFIAPMRIGTGLQNKLLEAMAMKIPCITSPLAFSALNAKKNEDILVGENVEEFSNLIVNLLNDNTLSAKLAEAGYQFVLKNYSWEMNTMELDTIMKNTAI
ncbi:MAG: glycosyltransferase [Bacteroidales bacterium]|jgi:sugar transferase (PEP-CTERM/EpsH1 system associated)|nr:glycosyltransferase [Bacteroidales bacterium]HOF80908.1 glycosyltransferase [Bacteroidales bacterium]HOR76253.1 glycosyltransferase [Bacteroidales bacterium]HPL11660.1 glycosyltransferase [Bacteroidales bacterium]